MRWEKMYKKIIVVISILGVNSLIGCSSSEPSKEVINPYDSIREKIELTNINDNYKDEILRTLNKIQKQVPGAKNEGSIIKWLKEDLGIK